MKKVKSMVLGISVALFLTGCNGSLSDNDSEEGLSSIHETEMEDATDTTTEEASTQNEDTVMKEVVFLNKIYFNFRECVTIPRNEYTPYYEWESDPDTLYAFYVIIDHYQLNESPNYPSREEGETDEEYSARCGGYRVRAVKELLQKEGFIFVKQETPGFLMVAATREQIEHVFSEMENLEKWYIRAQAVERPDMNELLIQAGWDEKKDLEIWLKKNMDTFVQYLGTDANQITVTVPVILPEGKR